MRRCPLPALLLSAAMVVASVASPCIGRASSCTMAWQMDCCRAKIGISAPRCCDGREQVGSNTLPATPQGPVQTILAALAAYVVLPVALAVPAPTWLAAPVGFAADAAPPGGTLIAQHTSLLL